MSHTRGPWVARGTTVLKSDGFRIRQEAPRAAAPEAHQEILERRYADARLIAAAPDMYDFLNEIRVLSANMSNETKIKLNQVLQQVKGDTSHDA